MSLVVKERITKNRVFLGKEYYLLFFKCNVAYRYAIHTKTSTRENTCQYKKIEILLHVLYYITHNQLELSGSSIKYLRANK
jgi:hypothetical protein